MMESLKFPQPKLVEKTGEKTFQLKQVILPEDGSLDQGTALLAEDYPALAAAKILHGGPAQAGSLTVRLGQPDALKNKQTYQEGYALQIGETAELTAQSLRAALYGLRAVMEAENGLHYGLTADWPSVQERSFHLDMARKFYSKDKIKQWVRDLSRNRMNAIWLHFSENEGFRIASSRHPEVTSLHHLTKDDVREIIALCSSLQIDVNPSLDCPGHLGAALLGHPRWRMEREMAEPLWSALDITNPDARAFLMDLMDEYAELFAGSRAFNIGGDEFIDFNHFERFPKMGAYAKEHLGPDFGGVDVYVDFINQVAARVRAKGFQVRVWNDGFLRPDLTEKVELDRDVQIAFWCSWDKGMAPLQAFLDRGYQVVNYDIENLYYILLIRDNYADPDPENLLHRWDPAVFPTHPVHGPQTLPADSPQMLGSCYSIWSDWPDLQDEQEVYRRSKDSIRAFGIRCWK